MTFKLRLQQALKDSGFNQSELARALKIEPQSVQAWLRDENPTTPRYKRMEAIANTLGVSPAWLMGGLGDEYPEPTDKPHNNIREEPARPYGKIPVIADVQAGNFCDAIDNFQPGDAEEWIPSYMPSSPNSFGLKVQGESMKPVFNPGEIVVVDPERAYHSGSYVVAKRASDERVTLKKLMQDGPDYYLEAVNPEWPNRIIIMSEEWRICGVVIYSHRVHI